MKVEHSHSPEAIRARLAKANSKSYLRDWVYGGIDGTITTFAIVSGVEGAQLPTSAVMILGLANIVADGFSMAASNYLGTKTESEELEHMRRVESRHIDTHPEGEKEEVRQLLIKKGFEGELLKESQHFITADKKRWIDFMLVEEYGLSLNLRSPMKSARATFFSFAVCGAIPLLPFLLGSPDAFLLSTVLVSIVFFGIGSIKSKWSTQHWAKSGLVTMLIGGFASGLAYLVGLAFRSYA